MRPKKKQKKVKNPAEKSEKRGPFTNFSKTTYNVKAALEPTKENEVDTIELQYRNLIATNQHFNNSLIKAEKQPSPVRLTKSFNPKEINLKLGLLRHHGILNQDLRVDSPSKFYNNKMDDLKSLVSFEEA